MLYCKNQLARLYQFPKGHKFAGKQMGTNFCTDRNDVSYNYYSRQSECIFQAKIDFSDNYAMAQTIGKGSSGEVKLAYHILTHKKFAIKIIDKASTIISKSYNCIMQQKKILELIVHSQHFPFISHLLQCLQDLSNLYFVLEYLPYGNLRKLIQAKKSFNLSQLKFLCICVLLSLKFLYQHKVIHGDLKPENILIDEEGYFCVADFSSARFHGCDNKEIKGTKGYMAPQLKKDDNMKLKDSSSDLYSLGTILWEMAYGTMYSQYLKIEQKHTPQISLTGQSSSEESVKCDINDPLFQNFLSQLLKEDPKQRPSIKNVMKHSWLNLSSTEINLFLQKKLDPHPFSPVNQYFSYIKKQSIFSLSYSNRNSMECEDDLYRSVLLNHKKYQDMFASFTQSNNQRNSRLKMVNNNRF